MEIKVCGSGQCWICGRDNLDITDHHALPKHLKPIHNVLIPLCERCHHRLNIEDLNGMYSYLFRIKKRISDNVGMVDSALRNLEELKRIKKDTNVATTELEEDKK